MDNLSLIVIASQQHMEGLITAAEWRLKMVDLIVACNEEEVASLCSLIEQYALHLRTGH
jgi:hypothetical protein